MNSSRQHAVATTSKEASKEGSLVFLVEELGDARVRAEQLKGYIDRALSLIDKSKEKEHIYEMAGGIIAQVPDVLFKLLQALRAAAMATSKLDYETLKSQIAPGKVEELESVLDDVRIKTREVDSTPKKVAAGLRRIASELESPNPPKKHRVVQSIWELVNDRFVMDGGYYYAAEPLEAGARTASASKPHHTLLLSSVKALLEDGDKKEGLVRLASYLAASGHIKASDLVYQASGTVVR